MNSDYLFNSSIFDAVLLYCNELSVYVLNAFAGNVNSQTKKIVSAIESLPESLYFNEFQWNILQRLFVVLFVKLALIVIVWKFYGKRICERFMILNTSSKAIEELKASVSRLKLPKDHTPRI